MSGSAKGRVIGNIATRAPARILPAQHGVCAWCGEGAWCPGDLPTSLVFCGRCGSHEIDWIPPPAPPVPRPPDPHQHFCNAHTPGSVALVMLGGIYRAPR